MSKDVPRLDDLELVIGRVVGLKLAYGCETLLSATEARRLAALLREDEDHREALAFILAQGADAIEAQHDAMTETHAAWLKTRSKRP